MIMLPPRSANRYTYPDKFWGKYSPDFSNNKESGILERAQPEGIRGNRGDPGFSFARAKPISDGS